MPFNQNLKKPEFKKISDVVWEIPTSFKKGMKVPARIYATKKLIDEMDLAVFDQITNVATLPGVINYAFCMSDGHSGYGFPIGGVAAMDTETGVISPGGVGFDINCGMRLVLTNLTYDDVKPHLKEVVDNLFQQVPAGVGSSGFVKLTPEKFVEVAEDGAVWAIENGYGWKKDLQRTEENGKMQADSSKISKKSIQRGMTQVGTLGSGNHYLEIQVVKPEFIYDEKIAKAFGIFPNQVVIMFHCGSRGFGHQVASDYLELALSVMERKYGIKVIDRELAALPFNSKEGQDYFAAMKCGVNMSFANRQVILHRIREVFAKVFKKDAESLGIEMVYDVAHNTAKLEKHKIDGETREVVVHRKGATRSFGPNREEIITKEFMPVGQPVIIGGSMETGSYLLVGTDKAMDETFGSTCHGSGRTMSRTQARRQYRGETLQRDMEKRGVYVKSVSFSGLAEEAGPAYKDIDDVIDAVHTAGISKKVVRFIPIGNVKG